MKQGKKRQTFFGIVAALLLVVTGCNLHQEPGEKKGADEGKGKEQTGKVSEASVHKDVRVEFQGELETGGHVQISINEEVATVWYSEGHRVYLGTAVMSADGVVKLMLQAAQDGGKKEPFEGKYDKGAKSFTITKLTERYLKVPKVLDARVKGLTRGTGTSFVRYAKGVVLADDGALIDGIVTFIITVDGQDITVTAFYKDEKQGFRTASGSSVLKADKGQVVLVLGGVEYETVTQLSRSKAGAVSVKSFHVSRHNEKAQLGSLLSDSVVTQKKGLRLCDKDGKEIGSLDIELRGSFAVMKVRQVEKKLLPDPNMGADIGDVQQGLSQTKTVMLEKDGEGAYRSKALRTAAWTDTGTSANHYVRMNDEQSVFVFVHTADNTVNSVKYNTYDIRITGYDPKTKRFYVSGRYLLGETSDPFNNTATSRKYGGDVLLGGNPQGEPLYIQASGGVQKLVQPIEGYVVTGK